MLIFRDLYNMSPLNAFPSVEMNVDNNCCVRDIRVVLTASLESSGSVLARRASSEDQRTGETGALVPQTQETRENI